MALKVLVNTRNLINDVIYVQMNNQIILYTRPDCSYSDALKSDLIEQSIDFEEIDLSINPEKISVLEELTGGERITPVLVNGDTVQIGYYGVG